jgi:hypothetical protein
MASDDRTLLDRLARAYPSFQTLTAADFPAELLPAFHKVDTLRRRADAITGNAPLTVQGLADLFCDSQ